MRTMNLCSSPSPEAIPTAFRIDDLEMLKAFNKHTPARSIEVRYALDSGVARGFFVRDPHGNPIEIYAAIHGQRSETPPLADPHAVDRLIGGS
jgi:catechol-2,3-dioxygenase